MYLRMNEDVWNKNGVIELGSVNGWDEITQESIEHKPYDRLDDEVSYCPFMWILRSEISRTEF
jgi:hypothetical protein